MNRDTQSARRLAAQSMGRIRCIHFVGIGDGEHDFSLTDAGFFQDGGTAS